MEDCWKTILNGETWILVIDRYQTKNFDSASKVENTNTTPIGMWR